VEEVWRLHGSSPKEKAKAKEKLILLSLSLILILSWEETILFTFPTLRSRLCPNDSWIPLEAVTGHVAVDDEIGWNRASQLLRTALYGVLQDFWCDWAPLSHQQSYGLLDGFLLI
jgi:hypothetical protein